jgi:hypothetical protein
MQLPMSNRPALSEWGQSERCRLAGRRVIITIGDRLEARAMAWWMPCIRAVTIKRFKRHSIPTAILTLEWMEHDRKQKPDLPPRIRLWREANFNHLRGKLSNWSSGLTEILPASISSRRSAADPAFWAATWDRLHGTLRLKIPQREITLGVPHWRTHDSVSPPAILAMPLQSFPRVWHLRGDGEPSPHVSEIPRNHLLPGAHRKTPVATATY